MDVLPGRGRNETVSYISCLFVGVLPAWAACCGGAGASQRRGEVEGVGGKGGRVAVGHRRQPSSYLLIVLGAERFSPFII